MKNRCNFKLVFGIIISALIFVSCTYDENFSNNKLEFNKVLNFSYKTEIKSNNQLVTTLTVPENKVWKIETASLYIDDNYSTSSCGLYMNEHVLLQDGLDYSNKPYLVSGSYKLSITTHPSEVVYYDYGFTALSILEYDVK